MTDGVVLYDKPAGITSHDVVAAMRRALGVRSRGPQRVRVGHAGTLDPFATGLLLVLVGRATRVQRFLMELPKTYEVTARFGAVSSTGDPEGEIVSTGAVPEGDLVLPVGGIRQRPPAYSAVKVGGRRAYALARAGEAVELAEREVHVYRFQERWRAGDRRGFAIECSSGTYVRSLIAALGDAYCEALRRVRIGAFDVADADPDRIVPLAEALAFIPEVRLGPEEAWRAAHGGAVAAPGGIGGASVVRLTGSKGLIALAAPRPDGTLRPVVGLRGQDDS
ncbi:MAG TPA: tRNA pseudouridine(55) synthase TruB [Solirubrobacteraceae bacterium]|nr:tRNA pseudouridine(55) synthase TruB [Solirubrobacteraceae bacterium]